MMVDVQAPEIDNSPKLLKADSQEEWDLDKVPVLQNNFVKD